MTNKILFELASNLCIDPMAYAALQPRVMLVFD
jgi:hypothetical protein